MKEYEKDGDEISQYYLAGDQPVARKMYGYHDRKPQGGPIIQPTGLMTYYHYDGLGNVMDLTDTQGRDVAKFRYSAFGEVFAGIMSPYNYHGITGKEYDAKAGLMHYSSRWYDPSVGRFTQPDTYKGEIGQPQLSHPYVYVGNNPINRIDPTGHYMEGDEDLGMSDEDWDAIGELGDAWNNTDDPDEKAKFHEEANRIRDRYRPGGSGGDDTGSDWDDDDDDGGYSTPSRPAYETREIEYNGTSPGINPKISSVQAKQPPLNMDLKTKQLLAQDARIKGTSNNGSNYPSKSYLNGFITVYTDPNNRPTNYDKKYGYSPGVDVLTSASGVPGSQIVKNLVEDALITSAGVIIPKEVERQAKKLSPEAKKGLEKALEALETGDTRGLNDHPLSGNRKGQRAVDIKGTGKGRGAGRVIFEKLRDGGIKIIEIITDHKY
ncbi:MAG: hypothetical protein K0R93_3661 [Anaerosolibacter sp.]|jgi:RHS repeat-associated protein|uniref:RHS repeat-associated core domain-containing protein n=1 Tax=Anaerosolibacter sp. TaxID=1872527 RepID=UPI0026331756|nr:RHS repeat-associated core domain-containing protein [Anaerosolibacter sp.]MDF2548763.1 hypothetical protein [Anaerosolibacter sp.]